MPYKDPTVAREYARKYQAARRSHPKYDEWYRKYNREYMRKKRAKYPNLGKKFRLLRMGLNEELFQKMLTLQGNSCAICKQPFTSSLKPNIDHDHKCCPETNKACSKCVRGLLCSNCNRGLGMFADKIDLLHAAASYLSTRCTSRAVI